jgi:HAD superfamily hydrolase (TIGR01509 family)
MIKAITFDLDGVYFPSSGKAGFVKALEERGVSEDEVRRVFLSGEEMSRYKLGKMSDEVYWTWAANEWKLGMSASELAELLVSGYQVDPEVEAAVQSARRHGYETLVCSNNFPARISGLQTRFHFLDNFDAAVFSYEVGAVKPSEAIFTELVKQSGVAAQEIVYADDNPERLSGAKALGITTFVYNGFDRFVEDLKSLGVELDEH